MLRIVGNTAWNTVGSCIHHVVVSYATLQVLVENLDVSIAMLHVIGSVQSECKNAFTWLKQ